MDFLRQEIADKPPHSPIPSEREISQRLDISRMTVRKTIEELCRQQVLYRDGNRGTFVAAAAPRASASLDKPVSERQRVLFLDSAYEPANVPHVRKAFRLDDHQRLFRMVRLILDGQQPLRVEEIYTMPEAALDKGLNELESFFQLDLCRQTGNVSWELLPALIPAKYLRLLELRQGTPVICRREEIRSRQGELILYVQTWYHPRNARLSGETFMPRSS